MFVGRYSMPGVASPTRGVFLGGIMNETPSSGTNLDIIDYVTIQTMGDGLDFGDLSAGRRLFGACSNTTRGITGGGMQPSDVDTMEYITIASAGNALDFGNLLSAAKKTLAASSLTRGVFAGGYASPIGFNCANAKLIFCKFDTFSLSRPQGDILLYFFKSLEIFNEKP